MCLTKLCRAVEWTSQIQIRLRLDRLSNGYCVHSTLSRYLASQGGAVQAQCLPHSRTCVHSLTYNDPKYFHWVIKKKVVVEETYCIVNKLILKYHGHLYPLHPHPLSEQQLRFHIVLLCIFDFHLLLSVFLIVLSFYMSITSPAHNG